MRPNEVILQLLDEQNISQRTLARLIESSPQTVNNQLTKAKSMKLDTFAVMLDALGYEMSIIQKTASAQVSPWTLE